MKNKTPLHQINSFTVTKVHYFGGEKSVDKDLGREKIYKPKLLNCIVIIQIK